MATQRLPIRTEATEQEALFDFLNRIQPRVPAVAWAFHVPNGGARHKATAVALKRQGVKRGVPDVLLPLRRGEYTGFACELKVGENTTSHEQRLWLEVLKRQGWVTVVCWNWPDAAKALLVYLGEAPEDFGL